MKNKKSIYISILIVIVMIICIAYELSFNRIQLYPKYNFIYTLAKKEKCQQQVLYQLYLALIPSTPISGTRNLDSDDCNPKRVYLFDVEKNSTSEITMDSAKQLTRTTNSIYPTDISPDGFEVGYYCSWLISLERLTINKDSLNVCLKQNYYINKLNIPKSIDGNVFYFLSWIP